MSIDVYISNYSSFSTILSDLLIQIKNKLKIKLKIASLSRQEPKLAGTTKWAIIPRLEKIQETTLIVRNIQNPQDTVTWNYFHTVEERGKVLLLIHDVRKHGRKNPLSI